MAHRGLHMLLPVVLVNSTNNFIKLPKSFGQAIRNAFPSSGVVALRLGWQGPPENGQSKPMTAFAGWSEGICEGHWIQVPTGLAETIGLKVAVETALAVSPESPLVVSVAVISFAPIASRVEIDPVTPDDWEILQLHANFVEEELLSQICVIGQDQKFPVWIHGHIRINMQVSKIALVEQGQALCVRLARNTEVLVAPKLRAKEDQFRKQSLRQKEQEASKTAVAYELRVQRLPHKRQHASSSPEVSAESFSTEPFSLDHEDWNGLAAIHPTTLEKLGTVAKWPTCKVLRDGSVVLADETSKGLVVVVCNKRRFALIDRVKKTKRSQKRAGLISPNTSTSASPGGQTHLAAPPLSSHADGVSLHSLQLVSLSNQCFVRLIVSPHVAPGHILLPNQVQVRCKLGPLEHAVIRLARFEPIKCPDTFPALCIHLTPVLGQEEAARCNASIDSQFIRDAALAAQSWQHRTFRQKQQTHGIPIYDGALLALDIRAGNGVVSSGADGRSKTIYFVARISDDASTASPSDNDKDKDVTTGEKAKEGKSNKKKATIEPVHWLLESESKVEWTIDKFIVDACLQKLTQPYAPSAEPFGQEDPRAQTESGWAARSKARMKNLLSFGVEAYATDTHEGDIQLSDLGAVQPFVQEMLHRLLPVLDRQIAHERVLLGTPHPGGVYLTGGRGYGKSTLARALAAHLSCNPRSLTHTVWIPCAALRGGKRSDIESVISGAFREALANAPSLLVFDDLDLLLPAPAGGGDGEGGGTGGEDSQLVWLAEWIEDLLNEYQTKLEAFESLERESPALRNSSNTYSLHRSLSWIATGREKGSLRKSLLRPGVFDKVVQLQPLNAHGRTEVLESLLRLRMGHHSNMRDHRASIELSFAPELDLDEVAAKAEGYAPADLEMLAERAIHCALQRVVNDAIDRHKKGSGIATSSGLYGEVKEDSDMDPLGDVVHFDDDEGKGHHGVGSPPLALILSQQDFQDAIEGYTPAALRGVSLAKSDVNWSDVGGLHSVRNTLKETLELPIQFAPLYERSPQRLASGILLYGPPGCGKTLLAGAVAKECGLNFISVKGPEVLNKYIGASEQAVRDLFARGAAASPCVVFFDEFDAIAPRRGNDSSGVTDRVVNQLLTFLDGVEARSGVYVMAATSRPDLVDPALLRPGRLDKQLLCGFPDIAERADILRTIANKMELSPEADAELDKIARLPKVELFTGADLQAILYSAQLLAVHEGLPEGGDAPEEEVLASNDKTSEASTSSPTPHLGAPVIRPEHLHKALDEARPSVSKEDRERFMRIYEAFKGDRSADFNAVSGYPDGKQRTALK